MIPNLRKWALFIAATVAVAIIGCGGGGSDRSSTSATNATTATTASNLSVNLNEDFGTIQFTYLTGQGRAPGDLVAVVRRLEVEDQLGTVRTVLETPHRVPLDEYVIDMVRLNVPFTGESVRLFEQFTLDFVGFEEEGVDGSGNPIFMNRTPPPPVQFPARIRVLPGRDTSVPIFLDDSMFTVVGGSVEFNEDAFRLRNNLENASDELTTYFSDYVSFDLSGLSAADAPTLSNGQVAQRVFLSGDNYALGTTDGSPRIEVLTLDAAEPIVGTFGPEGTLGGRSTPGTYDLKQIDPTDLAGIAQITAAAGVWRDYTRVFTGFGSFEFITFPTSRHEAANSTNGNGIDPDQDQELAIVRRNAAGVVTAFYFGFADLDTGAFTAYPINQLVSAGTDGEISGTLTNYTNANGGGTVSFDLVRRGTFSFTGPVPSGFPTTGTFVVYRK